MIEHYLQSARAWARKHRMAASTVFFIGAAAIVFCGPGVPFVFGYHLPVTWVRQDWVSTQGEVTDRHVVQGRLKRTLVQYRFEHGGSEYKNKIRNPSVRPGDVVTVYYDAASPSNSTLTRPSVVVALMKGGVFLVIASGGTVAVWVTGPVVVKRKESKLGI